MSTYFLIFGQTLIDLIILALLIWLIKVSGNKGKTKRPGADDFQIPEGLVKEMREIAENLDKNLDQKKILSHDILARLNEGLEQAEAYTKKIEKINEAYGYQLRERVSDLKDREQTRSSIQALMSKGFSREEIARHLGMTLGEIDLLIKLKPGNLP
jgi:DNA-binding NarL/FixJ family response regulator